MVNNLDTCTSNDKLRAWRMADKLKKSIIPKEKNSTCIFFNVRVVGGDMVYIKSQIEERDKWIKVT